MRDFISYDVDFLSKFFVHPNFIFTKNYFEINNCG